MLDAMDAWLIDKAEKFSHFTQRWLGIAAPTWERFFLCLCMVDFANRELSLNWGRGWIVMDIFMLFCWMIRFGLSFYKQSNDVHAEVVRNAKKLNGGVRAVGCLVAAMALPLSIWRSVYPHEPFHPQYWFVYWQVAMVFGACDDLPWGPSKARKFFQFAINALAWKAPEPEPVSDGGGA